MYVREKYYIVNILIFSASLDCAAQSAISVFARKRTIEHIPLSVDCVHYIFFEKENVEQ